MINSISKTNCKYPYPTWQRWSRGHKARGQGQGHKKNPRPRPRTAFPRTDTLEAKDRNARGQGQGPRTQAQVLSKKKKKKTSSQKFFRRSPKKKKVFTKIFQAISTKKRFLKNFSSAPQNLNNSKDSAVLEPRTGQFSRTWGLEAKAKDLTFEAKAKDFKMCPRGQGRPRGLHLCYLDDRFVRSDVIATGRKYRYRFASGGKLILFKHILLSSILVNNRVIVIENRQKSFQLQLQLLTFEILQLQLQQNCAINYNFVNYN